METSADQAQSTLIDEADEAETLQSLIDAAAETVDRTVTGTQRKAELEEALANQDSEALVELQVQMEKLIDQILANKITDSEDGLLSPGELYDYLLEHLVRKDVERLLEVRHKMMRARVFAHITAVNAKKGLPDPAHTPGEAEVPKLKKKFTREGGQAKAVLDHDKLMEALGDLADQVFRSITVSTTKTVLDEDALLALVRQNPALLDKIKDCVVIGDYGVARFTVRKMD